MRTSSEKVRISDEPERVQSASYPYIRSLCGLCIYCNIIACPMPTEETGETKVRTDCLNFNVSLFIQIKKQYSIIAAMSNPNGLL